MWQARPFQKTNGRLISRLLRSTFDSRTNMILKAFSAPSATLHGTTMRPGANTIMAGTASTCFTQQLMHALLDLQIEVQRRHVTDDAILLEVMIRGRHLGEWRSLPATGRLSGVYTFDADDRLAGERIHYDRGTVLRQLGVFHEPQSVLGQISILATHPATIARALARKLLHG